MKKKSRLHFLLSFLAFFLITQSYGQNRKNLAEKLGYPKNAKLLIIHADDAGVSHAENMATISVFEKKDITSTSIMVPSPWFPEIAKYAKAHPEFDFGIHITLTSEWKNYRWQGVLPYNIIPSLIDKEGYFYPSEKDIAKYANPNEVEKEVRAQIKRALLFGINLTHLDSHMGSIFQTPALFEVYLKLGREFKLPVFIPMNMITQHPQLKKMIPLETILVDNLYMMSQGVKPKNWFQAYRKMIESMPPGLNELIVHIAFDNDEMRAITFGHPNYGVAWRQRDYNFITDSNFKKMLKENSIILVNWSQIKKLTYPN